MNSIISILQKKVKVGYNIGMNSPDYTPFWEETLRQIKQNLTENGRANDFVLIEKFIFHGRCVILNGGGDIFAPFVDDRRLFVFDET